MPLAAQATSESAAQQQTTPPAAAKAPAATDANYAGPMDASRYVIGPQDSLQITVWKEPTLSGTIPVRPDGMISLVLVGDMPAAGQTPMALSADITQRAQKVHSGPRGYVVVLGGEQPAGLSGGRKSRTSPGHDDPGHDASTGDRHRRRPVTLCEFKTYLHFAGL